MRTRIYLLIPFGPAARRSLALGSLKPSSMGTLYHRTEQERKKGPFQLGIRASISKGVRHSLTPFWFVLEEWGVL